MKHLIKFMFLVTFSVILMQSCVNKDYDWDDIDKSGVLSIPPVMFGNVDTIYLEGLPEGILPEGISIPDFSLTKSDTIRGIFDGDAVKDFFFDGAGAVEISAKADLDLEISGLSIDLYFEVINYSNQVIKDVKIADFDHIKKSGTYSEDSSRIYEIYGKCQGFGINNRSHLKKYIPMDW